MHSLDDYEKLAATVNLSRSLTYNYGFWYHITNFLDASIFKIHTYWFLSTPPKWLTVWVPVKLLTPFKTIESLGTRRKWFENEGKNLGSKQNRKSYQLPIHCKIVDFLDLRHQPLCRLNSFLLKLKVHILFLLRKLVENIVMVTWPHSIFTSKPFRNQRHTYKMFMSTDK